jgi:hypothetical protein
MIINSVVLNIIKTSKMPIKKNISVILFITIAFKAALLAKILVYQKLINKYEHNPTPSHPINI